MRILAILLALIACGAMLFLMFFRQVRNKEKAAAPPSPRPPRAEKEPLPVPPSPPPYVPPPVNDPALAAFVNRLAGEGRVTPDQTARLPLVRDERDIQAVRQVLLDVKDDDTVRHEAAELLRRSNFPGLTGDLIRVLDQPGEGERFRSWAVQHLGVNAQEGTIPSDREKILPILRSCLEDRHPAVRCEALLALKRLEDPLAKETALRWLNSPSPHLDPLRHQAIRVIREWGLKDQLGRMRELAAHPDETIRRFAIVTLGEWRDRDSRALLQEASRSGTVLVKRAAQAALKQMD